MEADGGHAGELKSPKNGRLMPADPVQSARDGATKEHEPGAGVRFSEIRKEKKTSHGE